MMDMAEIMKAFFEVLATAIDIIGVIIIIWGFILAFKVLVVHEYHQLRGKTTFYDAYKIRQILGVYILMGLEFMIASDIIHSFISRSLQELYYLALIVTIRTVISYFLGKELEHKKA